MDREEINAALCARIGAEYHPPIDGSGGWDARARRLEVLGDISRGARRLDYLRVKRSGNFGNNYIQLVHAIAVAEARGGEAGSASVQSVRRPHFIRRPEAKQPSRDATGQSGPCGDLFFEDGL